MHARQGLVVQFLTKPSAEIVDHITAMPGEGDVAFLLLRKEGEKHSILDVMVLKDGAPTHSRPANNIYLPVLNKLR